MSRYDEKGWPLEPMKFGDHAWVYVEPRGLHVFIEGDVPGSALPVRSMMIPWRRVDEAVALWKGIQRTRTNEIPTRPRRPAAKRSRRP